MGNPRRSEIQYYKHVKTCKCAEFIGFVIFKFATQTDKGMDANNLLTLIFFLV